MNQWVLSLRVYVRQSGYNFLVTGVGFIVLFLFRLGLMAVFKNHIPATTTIGDILNILPRASWFDLQMAFIFFSPIWLLSVLFLIVPNKEYLLNKLRCTYLWFYFSFIIVGYVMNFLFFAEYHENFNAWAFQFLYEDQWAVLVSAWQMYPLLKIFLGILGSVLVMRALCKKILQKCMLQNRCHRFSTPTLFILLLCSIGAQVIGFRGTYQSRPLKRRDASVSENAFLLKIVATPFHSLLWGSQDHKGQGLGRKSYALTLETLNAMSHILWGVPWEGFKTYEEQTRKRALGITSTVKPKHVFLIVMESQNNWTMIPPYNALGLNPVLTRYSEDGFWLKSFLPAGRFTAEALCALMTGLHEAGLVLHYQKGSQKPYLPSLPLAMKRLGFEKAHFFDAGYINWCRMDTFGRDQGFDAVFSAISAGKNSRSDGKVWGLNDQELLQHVFNSVDGEVPSFNMIMTITNHPPFPLTEAELEREGCPIKTVPEGLKNMDDGSVSLRIHAHNWYADHYVGDFIEKVQVKYGPCLFIVVGDHWSRYFLNQQPGLYERTSVPFMLYGPEVLEGVHLPRYMAGDHVDVMPTLVELLAPKGFTYHTHGKNLLDNSLKNPVGFGAGAIMTPDFIFTKNQSEVVRLPWARENVELPDMDYLVKYYEALQTLAEWAACDPESMANR